MATAPESPGPFEVECVDDTWRVKIGSTDREWLDCKSEHDARIIAQAPVHRYNALEKRRSGEAFASELERCAETLERYFTSKMYRDLRAWAKEARKAEKTWGNFK